jgi:hypothetical protein
MIDDSVRQNGVRGGIERTSCIVAVFRRLPKFTLGFRVHLQAQQYPDLNILLDRRGEDEISYQKCLLIELQSQPFPGYNVNLVC